MRIFFGEFVAGFRSLFRGIGILFQNRKIRTFALLPVMLNTGLVLGATAVVAAQLPSLMTYLMATYLPALSGALWSLVYYPSLVLLFCIVSVILLGFGYFFAAILASPFHGLLAERVLMNQGAIVERPFEFVAWLAFSLKLMKVAVLKSFLFIMIGLGLVLMGLIPGVGLLSTVGFFLMLAFDSMDYSFEVAGYGLRQRIAFFRKNLGLFCGIGCAVGLTFMVPLLNFFFFPASVIGSATLFAERSKSSLQENL